MPGRFRPSQILQRLLPSKATAVVAALAVVFLALWLPISKAAPPAPRQGSGAATVTTERDPIQISADLAQQWKDGDETITLFRGQCRVTQGETHLSSRQMVVWERRDQRVSPARTHISVYLEDDARLDEPGRTLSSNSMLFDLLTRSGVKLSPQKPQPTEPALSDPLYMHAVRRRTGSLPASARQAVAKPVAKPGIKSILPVQFQEPEFPFDVPPLLAPEDEPVPELQSVQLQPQPTGALRRIRVFPRSAVRFNVESFESNNTTPPEQVWIITGGVNLLVDQVDPKLGTVDMSADRIVIWTQMGDEGEFTGEGTVQSSDVPFQVYLEGNIVIRQGTTTLRSAQAYYDARSEKALLIKAEVKSQIPNFPPKVRVQAERIRQIAKDTYQAQKAFLTTSQFGVPGYRLQATDILLEPRDADPWFFWGGEKPAELNPETGELEKPQTLWATALHNKFFVEKVPVFYSPYMTFPAEDPNIPLRQISVQNDQIFGQQFYTTWNLYKLFGTEPIGNSKVNLHLDYLTKRGFQGGLSGQYAGTSRPLLSGPFSGEFGAYGIYDTGKDNLGGDRRALEPRDKERGRLMSRDRQQLTDSLSLITETGLLSDRNYLEQYDEINYDSGKDYENLAYLLQHRDNWSWSVMGRYRANDFYTQTQWLPKGDLYGLGEPLFGGRLTWSSHTSAGYANQRIATAPTDPTDLYTVLPFEGNGEGGVFMTRHEVQAPFLLGPFKLSPYAMGEAAYWQEDFSGNSLSRLYGSAGLRGSIEFTRIFREVQSDLFNLNGLAHKMAFDFDYSFSDSSQSLANVPQYNEFDDNAQEQFRRRLLVNTFGGALPATFEPRFYALRSGTSHNVTAPAYELVGSQQALRLGWRHRLQTKVGPLNAQRIKNWMTLDLETTFFPNATRDNFGEDFGLYGARYNWYIGDRTTLTASGYFDTFDAAQQLWSLGLTSQRSTRGSIYAGVYQIDGPGLHSQILTGSYSYQLSEKWVTTLGTAYDLGEKANRGQSLTLSRIGADFIIHMGTVIDPNKGSVGVGFTVEPRFAPVGSGATQLSSLLAPQQR